MKKEGFPKEIRIKKRSELEEIFKKGKKNIGKNLILYRLDSNEKPQKFGVIVNRDVKGAVKRNRIKRILREIIRKNKDKFKENERVLIYYRQDPSDKSTTSRVSYQDLLSEFENLVT
jgi:ribonuclease P protein component